MAQYRATLTVELAIDARTDTDATAAAARTLATLQLPRGCHLMEQPTAHLREIRPLDRRMVARIPNLPRTRVQTLLSALSEHQRLILAVCAQPQWGHTVFTALRTAWPTTPLETFVHAMTILRNEGWLHTVGYSVEQDSFPNLGVRAQWSTPITHPPQGALT